MSLLAIAKIAGLVTMATRNGATGDLMPRLESVQEAELGGHLSTGHKKSKTQH